METKKLTDREILLQLGEYCVNHGFDEQQKWQIIGRTANDEEIRFWFDTLSNGNCYYSWYIVDVSEVTVSTTGLLRWELRHGDNFIKPDARFMASVTKTIVKKLGRKKLTSNELKDREIARLEEKIKVLKGGK